MKCKGDNFSWKEKREGLYIYRGKSLRKMMMDTIELMVVLLNLMGLQTIMKMPFYLGMVNIL